jgi:hypothetical protein
MTLEGMEISQDTPGATARRKRAVIGTPASVGVFQTPQVFMKAGDVVEIEAEGIGVLRTPIVAG